MSITLMVDTAVSADRDCCVPQAFLGSEDSPEPPIIKKAIEIDMPITRDAVGFPRMRLIEFWRQQETMLAPASPVADHQA